MRHGTASDESGFTLVETLVATALTLLLTAIALAGVLAALQAVEQGHRRAHLEDAVAVTRQRLAEDLRQATRVRIPSPDSLVLQGLPGGEVVYVSSPGGPRRVGIPTDGAPISGDDGVGRDGAPLLPSDIDGSPVRAVVLRESGSTPDTLRVGTDTNAPELRGASLSVVVRFDATLGRETRAATVEVSLRPSLRRFHLEPVVAWPG